MEKSPDAFRTISEVSDLLDTPAHVLRFWESRFPQIKPVKRGGGRRYYRPADIALLGGIRHLLHEDGMTIRGVQKVLRENGVRHVAALGSGKDFADSDFDELLEAAETADLEPVSQGAEVIPLAAFAPEAAARARTLADAPTPHAAEAVAPPDPAPPALEDILPEDFAPDTGSAALADAAPLPEDFAQPEVAADTPIDAAADLLPEDMPAAEAMASVADSAASVVADTEAAPMPELPAGSAPRKFWPAAAPFAAQGLGARPPEAQPPQIAPTGSAPVAGRDDAPEAAETRAADTWAETETAMETEAQPDQTVALLVEAEVTVDLLLSEEPAPDDEAGADSASLFRSLDESPEAAPLLDLAPEAPQAAVAAAAPARVSLPDLWFPPSLRGLPANARTAAALAPLAARARALLARLQSHQG